MPSSTGTVRTSCVDSIRPLESEADPASTSTLAAGELPRPTMPMSGRLVSSVWRTAASWNEVFDQAVVVHGFTEYMLDHEGRRQAALLLRSPRRVEFFTGC